MKIEFQKSNYKYHSSEEIKKILCVLEKIKIEAELIPKQEKRITTIATFEFMFKCHTSSFEVKNILTNLKQEGFIDKFASYEEGIILDERFEIQIPKDFEERYEKYRSMLLDILKGKGVEKEEMKEEIVPMKIRPYCIIEGKWGFLKFNKYGERIKIGLIKSRHFRLLQCLTEPLGITKTVDSVFEAIRLPRDDRDSKLLDFNTMKTRKIQLIQWAIKELQKIKKLKGHLHFQFSPDKRGIQLETF